MESGGVAAEAANEMQGLQAKAQDALCPGLSPQVGSQPDWRTQVTEGPWRREEKRAPQRCTLSAGLLGQAGSDALCSWSELWWRV